MRTLLALGLSNGPVSFKISRHRFTGTNLAGNTARMPLIAKLHPYMIHEKEPCRSNKGHLIDNKLATHRPVGRNRLKMSRSYKAYLVLESRHLGTSKFVLV